MRPADKEFFRYFPTGQRERRWGLYVSGAGSTHIEPAWTDYLPGEMQSPPSLGSTCKSA